jgi:hypothetical protein
MSPNETDETKSPSFRCKIESPSGLVQVCRLAPRNKRTKPNGNVDYFFFDFFAGFLQQQAVSSPWVCVIAA